MNVLDITNYKPKEFADLLNVFIKTLHSWDREKTLISNRTPTNRIYYIFCRYLQFDRIGEDADSHKIVIYTMVSTKNNLMIWGNRLIFTDCCKC